MEKSYQKDKTTHDKAGEFNQWDTNTYNERIEILLKDSDTYENILEYNINTEIQKFNKCIKKLVTNDEKSKGRLTEYHPTISKLYGLTKIY